MKKIFQIQSIATVLLSFFLCASILNFYLNSFASNKHEHALILSKKASTSKANDFQIPFEEKEAEDGIEDDDSNEKDNSVRDYFFGAFYALNGNNSHKYSSINISQVNSQRINSKTTCLPLFICNRAILI